MQPSSQNNPISLETARRFVDNLNNFVPKAKTQSPKDKFEKAEFLTDSEASKFWKDLKPTSFPAKLKSTPPSVFTLAAKIGPLRKDVQDIVLATMFSNLYDVSHVSQVEWKPYHHFRVRKTQPQASAASKKDNSATQKVNPPTKDSVKADVKPTNPKGKNAQVAVLVRAKIIPKHDNILFEDMFPKTDLPRISLINGLPKCNKSTFNSLLFSKIRSAKSELKLKPTDRLPKDVVVHISRLIHDALRNSLNQRKEAAKDRKSKKDQKQARKTKKSKSPKVPTPERTALEFVSPQKEQQPSTTPVVAPQEEQRLAKPIDPQSIEHITIAELEFARSFRKDVFSRKFTLSRFPVSDVQKAPAIYDNQTLQRLGPAVINRLFETVNHDDFRQTRLRFNSNFPDAETSFLPGLRSNLIDTIRRIEPCEDRFIKTNVTDPSPRFTEFVPSPYTLIYSIWKGSFFEALCDFKA